MSAPQEIKVWVCDECGYWRQEKSTGVHQTTNPTDPNGRLVAHQLREATYVPARDRGQGVNMAADRLVLKLTVTCHKGGTWEVAAARADGSTARHRGMAEYDNAFFAVEDELDALHDTYLEREGAS